MKIVHVTSTDPAGSVINFVNAMNRHTQDRARAVCTARIEEYDFPADYGGLDDILDGGSEVEQLLIDADVIHLHKVFDDFSIDLRAPKAGTSRHFVIRDYVKAHPKKVVHHIHGHPNERDPEIAKERAEQLKALGWPVLASTPDLAETYRALGVDVRYFPNCVPINDVLYLPRASNNTLEILVNGEIKRGRYMIYQSPTNSVLKNVSTIREVVDELGRAGHPVFYWGFMNAPQEVVLRHKRTAHIVFDHMEGYYGLSSLEALSMGKATIAGLTEACRAAIADFFGVSMESLPWVLARNRGELMEVVEALISNPETMFRAGEGARRFMEGVWSDARVAERMAAFYRSL